MFIKLLILFICIPILEIYVLLAVDNVIGIVPTILMVLATGIAGAQLAKSQGLTLMRKIQEEMNAGRMPTNDLLDGALLLSGGLLLLTPGFCTDLTGFLLLAPFTRCHIKTWLSSYLRKLISSGQVTVYPRR